MSWTAPAFPALGIEDAHLRQSLLGALNGARVGDDVLHAQIVAPSDGAWFLCAHDIAFRIQTLEGQLVRMNAQDGAAMATLLDAADPLLAAIEVALGIALEPTDMNERSPTATIAAAIETATSRIDLALPIDAPLLPTPAPIAQDLIGHIPLLARIGIEGPRLSPIDAAALAPGDLLLLGPAPFAATLRPAKGAPLPGTIHPADRHFRATPR